MPERHKVAHDVAKKSPTRISLNDSYANASEWRKNMKNVLVVVDMQNDFIDGALGTKEAEAIVNNVINKVNNFDGEVIFTRDTHYDDYMDTQEGKKLKIKHCIKDSEGWEISKAIDSLRTDDMKVFDKPTFGSVELAKYLSENKELESVTLIGLCTDICVISNAMLVKAFMPEIKVVVDAKCCAGVTPQSHNNALEAMKMCQIEVENV